MRHLRDPVPKQPPTPRPLTGVLAPGGADHSTSSRSICPDGEKGGGVWLRTKFADCAEDASTTLAVGFLKSKVNSLILGDNFQFVNLKIVLIMGGAAVQH